MTLTDEHIAVKKAATELRRTMERSFAEGLAACEATNDDATVPSVTLRIVDADGRMHLHYDASFILFAGASGGRFIWVPDRNDDCEGPG